MFFNMSVTSALFAATAWAAEVRVLSSDHKYPVRAVDVLERRFDEIADQFVERRQAPSATQILTNATSNVALNPDGTLNMAAWNEETSQKCSEALSHLEIASNPSGTCICYNLPSLDTTTGVFEADLRLFKISEPSGVFSGIPPQNIMVGLSYIGASVSPVTAQRMTNVTRVTERSVEMEVEFLSNTEFHSLDKRITLELLQAYLFVGQIDPARMTPGMSMAEFEALVMPVLTLKAVNATGATISTNVSSNEAAFVTGVFSNQIVMSEFAVANAAVNLAVEQLRAGTVAFVLPGVQILIFPVGMVVTGIWLILGLAAYGYGTYMRISYAESFKRRKAMAAAPKRTL